MKLDYLHIVRRSLLYNPKGAVYQVLITMLLTAMITGSLMTGKSVRASLEKTSSEKLGNTGIVISSGIRYFDPSLTIRVAERTGAKCTGVLEIDGFCQNFGTGQTANNVSIYATDSDFFSFQGNPHVKISKGEVAVNQRLADYLKLKPGDYVSLRYGAISAVPADAPFSPGRSASGSVFLRVSVILKPGESGNFSLGISQLTPMNMFINRSDLNDSNGKVPKINRLLLDIRANLSVNTVQEILPEVLEPEDIGLSIRPISGTGGYEIISDRVFIDQSQVNEIAALPLKSFPVITYLANSISKGGRSTPYSFVSGLDPALYDNVPDGNGIVINRWLADDLGAKEGDTLRITWYAPDPLNRLAQEGDDFVVSRIADFHGIWADSLLMPEFPGIAGSRTCTDWDAGVSINTSLIRDKDEDYWNRFRGTPKAFINYEKGKQLWGNNFGPATSIRFDQTTGEDQIRHEFRGTADPASTGFTITDMPEEAADAAGASVDFSTLFLSLGLFIILSAFILLALVVSSFLEAKRPHINALYSIGFTDGSIERMLLIETGIIAMAGTAAGAFAGLLFNIVIINALNSVWQGAVQTDALAPRFDTTSLLTGFAVSLAVILVILKIKSSGHLRNARAPERKGWAKPSSGNNLIILVALMVCSAITLALSFIMTSSATMLSFVTGVVVFALMVSLVRQYYLAGGAKGADSLRKKSQVSGSYFSFLPSRAVGPVLFIAAGLFAVIITGVNRMDISGSMLEPPGGTGGYLLWGESSVPVKSDLVTDRGRKEYGLDEPGLDNMVMVAARMKEGNDASCLNLNYIASPSLLGIDPVDFIKRGAFSFETRLKSLKKANPWTALDHSPAAGTIYGIADQTVLQYGLKLKVGDTLKIRAENGQALNVIIAAGLKSSVFQGYVLIGIKDFTRYFPSVSGNRIFLVRGDRGSLDLYRETLNERLSEFGIHFESAAERLSSFFVVTNTYLSVFTILGGIGIILGVTGLGFVLIRNYDARKRDFGLMLAAGFSIGSIRSMLFREQAVILVAGIMTGLIPALLATRPSIMSNSDVPWKTIAIMVTLILAAGLAALAVSVRTIRKEALTAKTRKE